MDVIKAILYKLPGARFSLAGTEYSGLNWLDDRPQPTEEELEASYLEMVQAGVDPLKGQDWEALRLKLNQSPIFQKIYQLAKQSLPIQLSFGMVMQVVLVTKLTNSLQFYLTDLKTELGTNLSSVEIEEVNQILLDCGFGSFTLN